MFRVLIAVACLAVLPARTTASGLGFSPAALQAPLALPNPDWDSCHDDLDRTRRAASEASDAAEELKSKSEDFEQCKRDPESYDRRGDGCRSHRSDYESAVDDLRSKMEDLDRRLRDVQSSCGFEFTINRMSPLKASKQHLDAANQRLCASYRSFMSSGLTSQDVLKMCTSQKDEEWCKSCLGAPK
jgi:hypothetical protein